MARSLISFALFLLMLVSAPRYAASSDAESSGADGKRASSLLIIDFVHRCVRSGEGSKTPQLKTRLRRCSCLADGLRTEYSEAPDTAFSKMSVHRVAKRTDVVCRAYVTKERVAGAEPSEFDSERMASYSVYQLTNICARSSTGSLQEKRQTCGCAVDWLRVRYNKSTSGFAPTDLDSVRALFENEKRTHCR